MSPTGNTTRAASHALPHDERVSAWFPDFLRKELAPYPGRGAIVARMVIASTITAVLVVVFRIPGGSIAVLLAMILSREDIVSTTYSAGLRVLAFALVALFVPIGGRLFASVPIMHFLWQGISIFLCFYLLRILTNFAVASTLCLVVTNILTIWYLPGPAERNVENTLWQVAAACVGALVTLAVELVYYAFNKHDEVITGVDNRLKHIEELMLAYAADEPVPAAVNRELARYAVVGAGALRRHIARTADEPIHRMRMSTLLSLTGRSIDFAAAIAASMPNCTPDERERMGHLALRIAEIRHGLAMPNQPQHQPAQWEPESESTSTPLLSELEIIMSLLPSVLSNDTSLDPRFEILDTPKEESRILVRDAFTNPEYVRYALAGTLAAMLCYVFYMGLNWPALATSVTTCVLTGLTNIGSSRQRQVLRLTGAVLGGFVFGMGAQIFVLPFIDNIGGFALLCAAVSAVAAWITTASSRLSYAGLQVALAFYLIILSDPSNISLTGARDRVLGVLLGTFMMWLVFERFYRRPAMDEMVNQFIRNTRLLAELAEMTVVETDANTIVRVRYVRDRINSGFGEVNAQSDAVPFETGPERAGHMAARDRIRRWQAAERTFYLLQSPLLQFRVFANPAQRNRPFYGIENQFRLTCGQIFRHMAEHLESQAGSGSKGTTSPAAAEVHHDPVPQLVPLLDALQAECKEPFSEREQALFRMARTIGGVVDRMEQETAAEPLFSTE
ncbi:FUSC family protein [Terracidiphilus gabretensis]|uniref:FUSC family protein n=1 Tax=Terracidiphilus gabretensis TaxID=1577687 RepID=UPI00071BC2AD|nr:FUSC family protein [Terracidiphilus gabretensis]